MGRRGLMRRLAAVRRGVKAWLYADLGALLQGDVDAGRAARAVGLLKYLSELEREDGPGGLGRLLAGLPGDVAQQVRQELGRLLDEGEAREGRGPV